MVSLYVPVWATEWDDEANELFSSPFRAPHLPAPAVVTPPPSEPEPGNMVRPKERTRTFTGCRTCRSRHAKCDEAQPTCGTCRRLKLACGGYGARLFWISGDAALRPEQQQSHRGAEYRYPLFSESERCQMSGELAESLGNRNPSQLLASIDSACERWEYDGIPAKDLSKGPFGVFPVSEPSPASLDGSLPAHDMASFGASLTDQGNEDPVEEIIRNDWNNSLGDGNYGLFTDSLTDPAMNFSTQNGSPGHFFMPDASMTGFLGSLEDSMPLLSPNTISHVFEQATEGHNMDDYDSPTSLGQPGRALTQPSSNLPEHADHLLRYYKQQIDGTSTPIAAKRTSAWQMIFLPCALETFAEISVWKHASHTRSSILYSLLANSAFQLHRTSQVNVCGNPWLQVGVKYRDTAQSHLRDALRLELSGAQKAAYPDLLMAILAMSTISLFNGAYTFKTFLVDAERLIRDRGLEWRTDFKCRLLHHLYTHLRILAESISPSITDGRAEDEANALTSVRTFRIAADTLNMHLDPAQEKSQEIGYSDIHLDKQGLWRETLYPAIYGIPESLMTLLSQTVSFANEKTRLESLAQMNPQISVAMGHHIKTLESSIWSWSTTPEKGSLPGQPSSEGEALADHPQARFMVLALHSALIIYFYRRVYGMNAMILQDLVRKTLEYLEMCIEQMVEDRDFATSLAWPAFIAACEAVNPDLQERALKCLAVTDGRGVFFTPKPAREVVTRLWETRRASGDWTTSWSNVLLEEAL